MKNEKERDLYLSEKLKNIVYNTKYNFLKFLEEYDKDSLAIEGDMIYILGQKFQINAQNINDVRDQVYDIFQNIPWLTYRSGFPELPHDNQEDSYKSDTGWGCMVRVGQMLFAQVIKHHKNMKTRAEVANVLNLFSDCDKSQPFSIHRIASQALTQYKLRPGEWYNPSQIAYILKKLLKSKMTVDEKAQPSMAEQLKLEFVVFNSGNLFFDEIYQAMLQKNKKKQCACSPKSLDFICEKCNTAVYSVSVIILSRIGLNEPEKKYLKTMERLMESPSCQGVIGGKPQKALYFVGKHQEHFIYLDPHYVHEADKDVKSNQQAYFCASFRKCKNTSIDSSIGICYYLRDVKELNEFYNFIKKTSQQHFEDFFIFVSDTTPSYAQSNKIKEIQINETVNQEFQCV